MKLIRKFTNIFDGTINIFAFLATVLLTFIMLLIVTEISVRYFWGRPIMGTVEITGYALLYITFLAATWVLREERHVKVELVLTRLKPRVQSFLNITTSLISAIVFLVITWYGVRVTWDSYQINYLSPTELETPKFLIVLIIPIGSFLLSLQLLRRTYGFLKKGRA